MKQSNGLISQVDAARLLGVTRSAVFDLAHRGIFTIVELAGKRLLLRSEVEAWREKRVAAGKK